MAYDHELMSKCCMVAVLVLCSLQYYWVEGESQVPCFFIFGDSIVDNGNNNNLFTIARCNYSPYGIDFPNAQPTGRFCNGRTIVDITSELLGFKDFIPSFANSSGANILLGINYASAGAGIRNETGENLGARITFDEQMYNYQTTILEMNNTTGSSESTSKHLNKCLYYVGMGGNDYLNNYLMPEKYPTSQMYTPAQFAEVLIQRYSEQIKNLYDSGARKYALYAIGPVGCTPHEIGIYGTNGSSCLDSFNTPVQIFNTRLKSLVDDLNNKLTDAHFIYINIYDLTIELIANSSSYGFKVKDTSCCGLGKNNSLPCIPLQIPCEKRDEYLYWDSFHTSEAANKIIAQRSYHAQLETDTYPMDIHALAKL